MTTNDALIFIRPITPELHGDHVQQALGVKGSFPKYRWNTDCLAINKKDNAICINYHSYHHYDKYDEGLEKYFSVTIDKHHTVIKFDFDKEVCVTISSDEMFNGTTMPEMPEILKQYVDANFAYAVMDIGKNIYLTLCQIYKNKEILNIEQIFA